MAKKCCCFPEKIGRNTKKSDCYRVVSLFHLPDPGFARDLLLVPQLRFVTTRKSVVFCATGEAGALPRLS